MKTQKDKANVMSKSVLVLSITIVVFVFSAVVLRAALTNGFSVDVKTVDFVTDESVNMSGTLWVPSNATVETPAAGIVVAPGGNTPHTFYASYCIELARRGYVVFAYDYYGTVDSGMTAEGNSGALAAMKYLSGLQFVDSDRLGAIGHSNGGGQASAAILSEYAESAEVRSVAFIGCGIPDADLSVYDGVNVMAIWGILDECGQGVFWDVYHQDSLDYAGMAELAGVPGDAMEIGKYYGDPEDGSLRVLYTPNTFHSLSNIVGSSVSNLITYFDDTLNGNVTTLADNSFIYVWQEIAVLLMALSICIMIFPIGSILLATKIFEPLKRPLPEETTKASIKNVILLFVPGIISATLVKTTIMQGQTILGKLPKLFNVQSTNGFVWWFFLSALIGIIFYFIGKIPGGYRDREADRLRLKTGVSGVCLAVGFSLAVVGVPYLLSAFAEYVCGWYGRIFQTYFAAISPGRIGQYIVYYILFFVLFTIYAFIQTEASRIKGTSSGMRYLILLVMNALPAVIFLGLLYGEMIFTHVTPIDGREMSRAQGAMMGMLLLYPVIAGVVKKFYNKTGNIYVIGAINAALITWLSVNVQQFII